MKDNVCEINVSFEFSHIKKRIIRKEQISSKCSCIIIIKI